MPEPYDPKTCCKKWLCDDSMGMCPHVFGGVCDGFADATEPATDTPISQAALAPSATVLHAPASSD